MHRNQARYTVPLPLFKYRRCLVSIWSAIANRIAEAVHPISTRQTSLQAVAPSAGIFKMATVFFKRTRNRTEKAAQISVWTSKMETPYLELRLLCNLPGFTFYASSARMRHRARIVFGCTVVDAPYKEEHREASKLTTPNEVLSLVKEGSKALWLLKATCAAPPWVSGPAL